MTTTTTTPEFITLETTHVGCPECAAAIVSAAIHAKVTGSIGATYDAGGHTAKVYRANHADFCGCAACNTDAYGIDGLRADHVYEDEGDQPWLSFFTDRDAFAYSHAYKRCVYGPDGQCVYCARWDH